MLHLLAPVRSRCVFWSYLIRKFPAAGRRAWRERQVAGKKNNGKEKVRGRLPGQRICVERVCTSLPSLQHSSERPAKVPRCASVQPKSKTKPSKVITVSTFPALGDVSKKIGSELQEIQQCAAVPAIGAHAPSRLVASFASAEALWC
jgi:hypothetical protein